MSMQADTGRGARFWRTAVWSGAALLFAAPIAAAPFRAEMAWTAFDHLLWGGMLAAACGAFELMTRLAAGNAQRLAAALAIAASFLLAWISLAVGVIGAEDDPANLVFAGVLLVAVVGSVVARFRPHGLARALAATAGVQLLAGVYAFTLGEIEAVALSVVLAALWSASAALFRRAADGAASRT